MEISDTDVPLCLNPKEPCVVLEEFLPRENCTFGLICPVLEGNVCGSYGITISHSDGVEQGDKHGSITICTGCFICSWNYDCLHFTSMLHHLAQLIPLQSKLNLSEIGSLKI